MAKPRQQVRTRQEKYQIIIESTGRSLRSLPTLRGEARLELESCRSSGGRLRSQECPLQAGERFFLLFSSLGGTTLRVGTFVCSLAKCANKVRDHSSTHTHTHTHTPEADAPADAKQTRRRLSTWLDFRRDGHLLLRRCRFFSPLAVVVCFCWPGPLVCV